MVALSSLWLPILLASIAVFFLSFVLRMVSTHHLSDFDKLPEQDAVRDAMRSAGVDEGQYAFPHCGSFADMKSEAFQASWAEGPTGMLYVCPKGPWTMGKSLGQWFVMTLFVSSVVAWIAGLVIAPGAEWKAVAKVTGTIAFMSYGCAEIRVPIWKAGSWKVCFKELFDSALYAFAVASIFIYFWPGT